MSAQTHEEAIAVKEFLEGTPPLTQRLVSASVEQINAHDLRLQLPSIELHCLGQRCAGTRFFDPFSDGRHHIRVPSEGRSSTSTLFSYYSCRNCKGSMKTFALRVHVRQDDGIFRCWANKIGEDPAFGEPRPNVIKDVLDDEIEYFQRGYRSETAGLGIGAFAYYRRFVESHKDKLIDNLRKVAVAQAAGEEVLKALDRARKTNSFERAVDEIKDAIPPGMRLSGGHNPLTLLHSALSIGVHKDDDAECLSRAQDIRTVLTALATKTTEALADSAELNAAVGRLTKRAQGRGASQS